MDFIPRRPNDDRPPAEQDAGDQRAPGDAEDVPLTSDDFRRVGVQPDESRQTVIRQAASRRTKKLARRQLAAPSSKTERQLTEVATSTYRVLDPRNRDDAGQRAHVGRILPNALRVAGKTRFSDGDAQPQESNKAETHQVDLDDIPSDAALASAAPVTGQQLNVPWSQSLDDRDLLKRRRFSVQWVRKRLHHPLTLSLVIVALLVTSVWVYGDPAMIAPRRRSQSAQAVSRGDDSVLVKPSVPTAPPEPRQNPAAAAAGASSSDLNSNQTAASDLADAKASSPANVAGSENAAPVNDESVDPATPAPKSIDLIQITDVDDTMAPISDFDSMIEMELLLEQLDSLVNSSPQPATASQPAPAPLVDPEPQVLPVPPNRQRLAPPAERTAARSRQELEALVPALTRPRSPKTAELILKALADIRSSAEPGGVDDWTIRLAAAECKWLTADLNSVQQELLPLTDLVDVQLDDMLAETFVGMPSPLDSVDVHHVVMDNGMILADRLLVAEQNAACQRVLLKLRYSSSFLNDEVYLTYLDSFNKSLAAATRLRDTATRVKAQSFDDATAGEAGITGRYYCLMLRQWTEGLPWLARGSNPRLSALAKDELALASDSDLAGRLKIAERWLASAERSGDREADSMRLHAIKLLQQADLSERGVRQLKAQRIIEGVTEKLPRYLRGFAAGDDNNAKADSTQSGQIKVATVPPAPGRFSGRILGDAIDLGVGLQYESGLTIGTPIFEQLTEKLNREFSTWSVELSGQFELDAEKTIRLHFAETTGEMIQEIWLNDELLSFGVDGSPIEVSAAPGKYSIRWIVTANEIANIFLGAQDAETGHPIDVQPLRPQQQSRITIKIQR